ncbi:hypothetical protein [Dactylosporangium sp. CS-033363]|uniref:hypothetical protein n=1 Tax=Dactylosporangium sp. CS-033363 TaxID=3239935 RepID=UPI003D8B87A0
MRPASAALFASVLLLGASVLLLGACAEEPPPGTGIPFADAKSAGLVRTDAVAVEGPAQVRTGGRAVAFDVTVRLASADGPRTVDADFSGTCELSGTTHPRGVPAEPAARVTVTVEVPAGAGECEVVVDAWASGRTYTGDDLRTTFRP